MAQSSEMSAAIVGSTGKQGDKVTEEPRTKCRLLIFERDARVRDACAKLADSLRCDLYSTAYIDNFEAIVRNFQPTGIVIDVGLFEHHGVELLQHIAVDVPGVSVLFLVGDDPRFAASAESFAWSVGLYVEGILQRPVSTTLLEQSLRRMA